MVDRDRVVDRDQIFAYAPGLWDILPELARRVNEVFTRPEENAQLVGSPAWVARERHKANQRRRNYSPVKALLNAYRTIPSEVRSVNVSMDTILGKELSPDLVNLIELTLALYLLTERQRDAWLMETARVPRAEIATALETSEHAVEQMLSVAGRLLVEQVFDPDLTIEIAM